MSHPLIERARSEGSPLIDGRTATFLWEGPGPVQVIADFNGWDPGESANLIQFAPQAWKLSVDLPPDAYIEYSLVVNGERRLDPFNRRRSDNGFGKFNTYFYMPQARPSPYVHRRRGILRGSLQAMDIDAGWFLPGRLRKVTFYQPPVDVPCPLVVVWDGQDYLGRVRLPVMVDNLVGLGRIQPLALALVESHPDSRAAEYLCSDATIAFVQRYLLPAARKQLNLLDPAENPGAYSVLGASAGGLMAFYTGLRMPHIFGRVLAQSGAYSVFGYDTVAWDLVSGLAPRGQKFWLCSGRYDALVDCNRKMAALLQERDYDFRYEEYTAGHNYPTWRDHLSQGLEFIFPK